MLEQLTRPQRDAGAYTYRYEMHCHCNWCSARPWSRPITRRATPAWS